MRRKTLVNNLTAGLSLSREQAVQAVEEAGLSAGARAEELSIRELCALADRVHALRARA